MVEVPAHTLDELIDAIRQAEKPPIDAINEMLTYKRKKGGGIPAEPPTKE